MTEMSGEGMRVKTNLFTAFAATVLSGLAGIFLGGALNMEGYLGVILSIAVMGCFILRAVERRK